MDFGLRWLLTGVNDGVEGLGGRFTGVVMRGIFCWSEMAKCLARVSL